MASEQPTFRVERANRTLQDRLVKELRLAGISDVDSGNAFLPSFIERFNERFAVPPVKAQGLHRPWRFSQSDLTGGEMLYSSPVWLELKPQCADSVSGGETEDAGSFNTLQHAT
jgi:hypothetical protein